MRCHPSLCLLAGLSLPPSVQERTEFRAEPRAGQMVEWSISRELTYEHSEAEGGLWGEVVPRSTRERYAIADAVEQAGLDEPATIRRTYRELGGSELFSDSPECELSSELEGATVVFSWEEESGAYSASSPSGDVDAALLWDLRSDLGFGAFLPPKPVERGEWWELDPQVVLVRNPGGVALDPSAADPASIGWRSPAEVDGTAHATFRGLYTDDGVEVAVVDVEAHGVVKENEREMTFDMWGVGILLHETTQTEFTLEGEFVWNQEQGRLHELDLKGGLRQSVRTRFVEHGWFTDYQRCGSLAVSARAALP